MVSFTRIEGLHILYAFRKWTCYLLDGPERAFVSEELMPIPEDTELPPDYVQAW